MASKTTNYGLNKHSPQDFYNVEARNENWDKIDTELKNNVDAVNARVKTAELATEIKKVAKDGSLTAADLGAEKAGAAAEVEKKVDALGASDVGADPFGTAASKVSTHNAAGDAHSGLFKAMQTALDTHTADKKNPHNVTCDQINAAPKEHTHSADDIKSGILPIERGGTGAYTAEGVIQGLDIIQPETAKSMGLSSDATPDAAFQALVAFNRKMTAGSTFQKLITGRMI